MKYNAFSKNENFSIDSNKKFILSLRKHLQKTKNPTPILTHLRNINTKEPLLNNILKYLLLGQHSSNKDKATYALLEKLDYVFDHLITTHHKIAENGYHKIKKGMVVYVHDYSPYIINLLLKAKSEGINFEVVTTETSPRLTGFAVASHLAKHNIPVKFYSDLAIRQALKASDVVLLDADALDENGKVHSEIGSELIAELAERYEIPVYVCSDSWRYNPNTTKTYEKTTNLRPEEELWKKPKKGITIFNYGFEKIDPKLIAGIITELGIYKPHYLISEIKKQYKWI